MQEHKISIREVGLRDGLQMVRQFLPTERKLEWIATELAAGVTEIEVCSFVPARLIAQFADAEEVVGKALAMPGLTVSALIPNLKGAERAVALGVHKLNYVMSVSESHNQANVRRSTADSLADFARIVEHCRDVGDKRPLVVGGLSTAFGCTLEGRVDESRVVEQAVALVVAGADELTIADTVGYGDPAAVRRVFRAVLAEVGDVPVAAHFHDTRGLGLANVLAALDVGVLLFDASLAGLGGCPHAPGATGNVNTEDLAFMLTAMGWSTGIDLPRLMAVRRQLDALLPDEPKSGAIARAGLPKGFAQI